MATRRVQLIGAIGVAVIGVVLARTSAPAARLADPTFTKDVAPILYKNCTVCHRPGGIGPFSLMDYDSAKANLDDIHDAVQAGVMPPWHAAGPHGVFSNDRRLSDAEKETILRWIATGAKAGDPKDQPAKPVYTTAWTIGQPDAVVSMPEDFSVPAAGTVEYQYFQVPTNFTEDKWVQAIEVMPGAREVVHHVLVFAAQPPPANPPAPAPAPAAAPGAAPAPRPAPLFIRLRDQNFMPDDHRTDTLHPPPRNMGSLIGTETPGNNVMVFPPGAALRIRAGTLITFQMHYTA
jgi:hypothetical protein